MENKLQQLTEKLYNEGLSKGRSEAEALVADARKEAARIVAEAKEQAAQTAAEAEKAAQQLRATTENEIRMAAQQMSSALRQQIGKMVLMQSITPQLSAAWQDGSFVKELALAAVAALDPSKGLQVVLPAAKADQLVEAVKSAAAQKWNADVEVTTDSRVKVPFRIAPAEGGYYISFTDADFDALFRSYLRPRVTELLFGAEAKQGE